MRMNEVKSQISLVKGERNECQEVTSALHVPDKPRPPVHTNHFLGWDNAQIGVVEPGRASGFTWMSQPTTAGVRPHHPHPRGPTSCSLNRSSHSDSDVSGLGCWSFELLMFVELDSTCYFLSKVCGIGRNVATRMCQPNCKPTTAGARVRTPALGPV